MRLVKFIVVGVYVLLLTGGSSSILDNPDKDKLLIEVIAYVMQRGHYNPKQINDEFSEHVFKNYIEGIDGQHRFFLQSDINTFKRNEREIDDQINVADVSFFNLTYDRLIYRMNQVKEFYGELLDDPFDFAVKDSINLNFEELAYARTLNGLKNLWRKRISKAQTHNIDFKIANACRVAIRCGEGRQFYVVVAPSKRSCKRITTCAVISEHVQTGAGR